MAERKEVLRLGPGDTLPDNMPAGITIINDTPNDKVYVEDANGGKREFVEGAGTAVTGTLTASWVGDNTSIPYLRQGNVVILSCLNVFEDGAGSTLITLPTHLRPSATRKTQVYESDTYSTIVAATIATSGVISISPSADSMLNGNIIYQL
jgi:hypothetical protein